MPWTPPFRKPAVGGAGPQILGFGFGKHTAEVSCSAYPWQGCSPKLHEILHCVTGSGLGDARSLDWSGLSVIGLMGIDPWSCDCEQRRAQIVTVISTTSPEVGDPGKLGVVQTSSRSERSGIGDDLGRRGPGRVEADSSAPRPAPPRSALPGEGPRCPPGYPARRAARRAGRAEGAGSRASALNAPGHPARSPRFGAGQVQGREVGRTW